MIETKIHLDLEQGSESWHNIRLGRVGGSNCYSLLPKKDRQGNYKEDNILTLALNLAEDLDRGFEDFYQNDSMVHGIEFEEIAAEEYEKKHFVETYKVGYVSLGKHFGVSPDRWIGKGKSLEIKCPQKKGFRRIRYEQKPDPKHIAKCYWEMFVTANSENPISEIDLVYFHPEFTDLVTFTYKKDQISEKYFEQFKIGCEIFEKIWTEIHK